MSPMRRRDFLAGALATAALPSLAACSGSVSKAGVKGELRIGLPSPGSSLDPGKQQHGTHTLMRVLAYDSLVRANPDGTFSPGLAESWRYVGKGNKLFELKLRQGLRFADGAPVAAESVKASLKYFAKNSPLASNVGPIDETEVVDQRTVRLHVPDGNPILPFLLSDQIPSGAVISPAGLADPAKLGTATAGAGPYVLDPAQTVAGDHYTYRPNKLYHDRSSIRYERVRIRIIPDTRAMLQTVNTGQLDLAYGDVTTAASAKRAGLTVLSVPSVVNALFIEDLPGKIAPELADVRVRQALNYAIDRAAITKGMMGEYGKPTSALVTIGGFDEKYRDHYPYDPQKARSLLAQAGHPRGFTLKVVTSATQGVSGEPTARAVARDLAAVGVRLDLKVPPTDPEFVREAFNGSTPVLHSGWGILPMPISYRTLLSPDAPMNPSKVADRELERLSAQAASAADPETYWKQMTRRITEQALIVPLYTSDQMWYVAAHVGGVKYSERVIYPNPITFSPK